LPVNPSLPLSGIKVVDLTSNIAAPFAGAILADLGAEVVHVESLSGDDSRRMAPRIGNTSAYWQVVNRNKSIKHMDIRVSEDHEALDFMLSKADIFITNLRPGKLEKNGLDAKTLRARFPRLIHAALSAYGAVGEERDRAGYDAVLQSRTGIAEVTGTHDGPPVRAGVSVLDVGAGTWLALGIITALLEREKTGEGSDISTSLFETGANWVAYHVAANQISKEESGRFGSGHPAFSPYGIFSTATEQVCIGIGGDELFRKLCVALEIEELAVNEKFSTNVNRVANDKELRRILEKVLSVLKARAVVTKLEEHGVACDIVQKPEALLTDPQAEATQIMVRAEVEGFGELKFPGIPLTFNGYRPQIRNDISSD
jgi:crotonobetainyl-CoA:carnitine CoA-transferase CaiB-like acyl-CoA transferase